MNIPGARGDDITVNVKANSAEQIRRASLFVIESLPDVESAREVLDMLGILEPPGGAA